VAVGDAASVVEGVEVERPDERGRATPRIHTMEKIATALEVDPLEIAEFNHAIERAR
jgi:hypothetical protein